MLRIKRSRLLQMYRSGCLVLFHLVQNSDFENEIHVHVQDDTKLENKVVPNSLHIIGVLPRPLPPLPSLNLVTRSSLQTS